MLFRSRIVLKGILAMQSGCLDDALVSQLYQHFKSVTEDVYREETRRFIIDFCNTKAGLLRANQRLMINALFRWTYPDTFWQAYREMLLNKLNSSPSQFIELMSFWFKVSPEELNRYYLLQDFFYRLSGVLERAKNEQGYSKAIREFRIQAERRSWYPSLQDVLAERKSVFGMVGQGFKRMVSQRGDKETQEREVQEREAREEEFTTQVSALFEEGKVRLLHTKMLPSLWQNELFWPYYWDLLVKQVMPRNADLTLEVLEFWFDASFPALQQSTYAAQDFFLGLPQALELARKERGFRETAQRIDTKVGRAKKEEYRWYFMVQNSFAGAESGRFNFLRRG